MNNREIKFKARTCKFKPLIWPLCGRSSPVCHVHLHHPVTLNWINHTSLLQLPDNNEPEEDEGGCFIKYTIKVSPSFHSSRADPQQVQLCADNYFSIQPVQPLICHHPVDNNDLSTTVDHCSFPLDLLNDSSSGQVESGDIRYVPQLLLFPSDSVVPEDHSNNRRIELTQISLPLTSNRRSAANNKQTMEKRNNGKSFVCA